MWYTHTRPSGCPVHRTSAGTRVATILAPCVLAFETIAHAGTALSVSWALQSTGTGSYYSNSSAVATRKAGFDGAASEL